MNHKHNISKKLYLFLLIASLIIPSTLYLPPITQVAASSVSTSSSYLSMIVGNTATLKLSGITTGITWKSGNKAIVSVNLDGKVTAKKKGTTTVIATYKGSQYKWIISVKNSLSSACKTGDTSGLSETDQAVVKKVYSIISSTITSDMNDYEKVKAIHDYIILNCAYDTRAEENISAIPNASYHPEGCLLYKICVCQGYAESFELFMNALGIKSKLLTGYATQKNVETTSHAWNSVKLGNKWYQIDLTWDDPITTVKGYVGYNYFLRTDDCFLQDHTWNQENFPVCTGTSYLMKPLKEYIISNEAEAENSFLTQKEQGNTYYTFVYKTDTKINFDFLKTYSSFYPVERGEYTVVEFF